ncbi:MAG: hypothetical protein ABSA97_01430 [Verrucomicrobiia bacterium]
MSEQPQQIPAKRRRWPRRILVVILVLAALYAAYRYTLHRMVEAKLDEIRKQGYPVTLTELDKWYPQPPPGENAADVYENAFSRYAKWDYEKLRVLPVVGDVRRPKRGEPLPSQLRETAATYLAESEPALRLLHAGVARKRCRYPVSFSEGVETPLPHLNEVRQGARLLSLEATLHAAGGEAQSAASSISAAVALARSLTDEPGLVDQLVRVAVLRIDASCLEDILNRTAFADAQLRELDAALGESETTNGLARALGSEIVIHVDLFHRPVKRQLTSMLPPPPPDGFMNSVGFLIPAWYRRPQFYFLKASGLMEIDLLHHLRIMEGYLHAAQLPLPERLAAAKFVDSETRKLPKFCVMSNWLCGYGSGSMSAFVAKDLAAIASLRCCRTSFALERHRLASGNPPDRFDELVPTYLAAVPTDPFDGQLLRYKKLENGYVVYSVAEDGKDDGGDEKKDITFTVER